MKALHLTQALAMLDSGQPVSLTVVTAKGTLLECAGVVSLRHDRYTGMRTLKFMRSGQLRAIRDVMITAINEFEVYL